MKAVVPPPRIIGLLKVKNEWPLLAVTLTHALRNHVDAVYVLDHGSTDGTAAGLAALQASPLGSGSMSFASMGKPSSKRRS